MNKFNLIDIFLTVTNKGSFAGASAQMGVDPSTVSKSIKKLESHLGFTLFNRTTRQLNLTQAGEIYYQQCTKLLADLESCEETLDSHQQQPKGLLRINLPVAYGQLYIMPRLGKFCKQYPEIELEVSLTDDYTDIISQNIDIAIRTGQLKDSRLVARKLSPMDFATCASPQLLKKIKFIKNNTLQNQPWVHYKFLHTGKIMPIMAMRGQGKKKQPYEIETNSTLTTTDGFAMLTACKNSIGLIQAPHFLIREAINQGELCIVQSYYRHEQFTVSAYYAHKEYTPAKVRVFIDFIIAELAAIGENPQSTFLSKL